jgi:Uri superfamily endonuclease
MGESRSQMETLSGTYALIFSSTVDRPVQVGQLGQLHVRHGFYVYIGSAFGPGGVQARVSHHRARSTRPHWHIDYLREVIQLEAIWCSYDPARREHQWAEVCSRLPGASLPLRGFGASDCRCESHFYFFALRPSLPAFRRAIWSALPDHGPVHAYRINSSYPDLA